MKQIRHPIAKTLQYNSKLHCYIALCFDVNSTELVDLDIIKMLIQFLYATHRHAIV